MRKAIIAIILLCLFSGSINAANAVTGWERKTYYEAMDKVYRLPKGYSNDDYNNTLREIAQRQGLTFGEMKDIVDRVWDQDLTDQEWTICRELDDRLMALAQDASQEEEDKIYREVASKYGISVYVLYDIDFRAWGWLDF